MPRTATVRALSAMRLVALERERFIDAVPGHPGSRQVSEALIDARLGRATGTAGRES